MSLANDLSAYWMPFTDNRAFKAEPRLLAEAEGMHYRTPDGRTVLDATAGLWCVNAGHGRVTIRDAIAAQAATLDYAPSFQLGHPRAFECAARLAALMPTGLDRIVFANSGSEAVDSALKVALAYQRAIGQAGRTRVIGRERGYHGVGFGGLSVGGLVNNRRAFGPLLPAAHLRHTDRAGGVFCQGQPPAGADLAEDLERLIALYGAETIAAVIVEPVAGSTGVLPPPVGYLERLREIATRHGVLLIFDEVITAFGRLGAATAAERLRITPDLITLAKGLTNGAVPMGAVAVARPIHDAILAGAAGGIEFFHGYTYSGHPLAAAAALATLDLYAGEGLFERARALERLWRDAVHQLDAARHVVDVRDLGLMAGIDLEPRPGEPGARGREAFLRAFDAGLLVRVTGDIIALSPPLIVTAPQIAEITGQLAAVLSNLD